MLSDNEKLSPEETAKPQEASTSQDDPEEVDSSDEEVCFIPQWKLRFSLHQITNWMIG